MIQLGWPTFFYWIRPTYFFLDFLSILSNRALTPERFLPPLVSFAGDVVLDAVFLLDATFLAEDEAFLAGSLGVDCWGPSSF